MGRVTSPSTSAARHAPTAVAAGPDAAHATIASAAPWIERFARVGFAAKAVLYTIVGVLAVQAAFGNGGRTTGSRGALATLLGKEWGGVALIVMALGLFGYAAWRITEAILDPERKGNGAKGISLRLSYAVRGLLHAALAVQAVRLA